MAAPGTPTVTVTTESTAYLHATIKVDYGANTASAKVERLIGTDSYMLAEDVEDGEVVTDPLPPLGIDYAYKVTAYSSDDHSAFKSVDAIVETSKWAFNWGEDAAFRRTLRYNPQASYSVERGGEAYHFAGRVYPVFYATDSVDATGSLSFDVVGQYDADELMAAAEAYPVMWLRDPFGHRLRVRVRPSVSHGIGEVWKLTVNYDVMEFEEA